MFKPFFLSGSRSEDFDRPDIDNPLPPCPGSHNCVRISRKFPKPADTLFDASKSALKKMDPVTLNLTDTSRQIDSVFRIFIYEDDFTLKVDSSGDNSSLVYIRSSSRVGHTDFGVNRRRVKQFLRILKSKL